MLDYVKRVCIALALATFIGVLFLGTMTTLAAEVSDDEYDMLETFIWPTVGDITDTFGTRNGKHYGIDIAAPEGTPVVAVASGVVSRSYFSDSYGHVVFIKHENGLETVYAHLHARKVNEGENVYQGDLIGTVGNTGRSSGNHLHFEVHEGCWDVEKSQSIDPLLVLAKNDDLMYVSHDIGQANDNVMDEVITVMSYTGDEKKEEMKKLQVLIKPGDTLSHIAQSFQVTVSQIMDWNELSTDLIFAGDHLTIYTHT